MSFKKDFKIKNLVLPNNIIYAPLTEYTDFAFRKFIRHFHKGLIFCEMVKMEALVKNQSLNLLKFEESMRPIGAQIYGTSPKNAKNAAKKIEDLGFDLIDLNCGCPVPKVIKDGSGAALLGDLLSISKILESIISSVKIPVTLKIRLGWDEKSICIKEVVKIAEDVGCSAITIHGRTKKQGHIGKANWDCIKEAKSMSSDILIIGNGDLYTPEDVSNMFEKTKCDGVMIARGMLKNFNLAAEIENYFDNCIEKKGFNKKTALLKYIEYCVEEKGKRKALLDIKKICGWFLKSFRNVKNLRIGINTARSTLEVVKLINSFDWSNNYGED
jgi:tRNA-dihydrouridine synthase B